jgi:hypothetical protein
MLVPDRREEDAVFSRIFNIHNVMSHVSATAAGNRLDPILVR